VKRLNFNRSISMFSISYCTVAMFALFNILIFYQTSIAAEYRLSMLPLYSTEDINARITPLAEYLAKQTGLPISTTLTAGFNEYSQQLSSGRINIGFENPYIFVLNSGAHEVVAIASTANEGEKFRGIIITRSDSPLRTIIELKGKKIGIVGQTSVGGFLSQKLTLLESGIDVAKDCIIEEAPENKHENVIFSVFAGDVDAGFIRESALLQANEFVPAGAIRILQPTAWMPNWALSLSRELPKEDRKKIVSALLDIKPGSAVLKSLKVEALKPAQDSDYDSIRKVFGLAMSVK